MISLAWEGDYPISQPFGARPDYYAQFGLGGHEGIDVACPVGTRCRAVESGEVVEVGLGSGAYGYYVKLRTPEGADWLWAHLLPYDLPRPGSHFDAGSGSWWTGSSGNIQGVHLHLGFRPHFWERGGPFDGWVDPLPFL